MPISSSRIDTGLRGQTGRPGPINASTAGYMAVIFVAKGLRDNKRGLAKIRQLDKKKRKQSITDSLVCILAAPKFAWPDFRPI
jgi:hypothetical protein